MRLCFRRLANWQSAYAIKTPKNQNKMKTTPLSDRTTERTVRELIMNEKYREIRQKNLTLATIKMKFRGYSNSVVLVSADSILVLDSDCCKNDQTRSHLQAFLAILKIETKRFHCILAATGRACVYVCVLVPACANTHRMYTYTSGSTNTCEIHT